MSVIKKARGKQIRALTSSSGDETLDLEIFSGVKPLDKKFKSKSLPGKAPGVRRMRESEYSQLMKSKQIVRFYYGLKEGQFKSLYDASVKSKGSTGDNLLQSLELRLDNVVYRAGFASTRAQARQVVSHGHVTVNGKRLNIPSYRCKIGDIVAISEKRKKMELIQFSIELAKQKESQTWIDVDYEKLSVTVSEAPALEQLHEMFKISHVIELYSK